MNCSRALKLAALAVIIAITVTLKAVTNDRVVPATNADLKHAVLKLLSSNGFETQAADPGGFVIDARHNGCRLQVREAFAAGYNLDAIAARVPPGAHVEYAYRGELLQEHPTLRASFLNRWANFTWKLGLDSGWSPVLQVASVGDCALQTLPWSELTKVYTGERPAS